MLSYVWCGMMVFSFICAAATGRMADLSSAVFSGGESAISLCLSLLAAIPLWSGLMSIADKAGIVKLISRLLKPIFRLLFKTSPDSDAAGAICLNVSANMLGLANAATPFGIKAMQLLQKENTNPDIASDDMITFVLINTASVQLIPTTVAQIRAKYGSAAPMDIICCVWITCVCTLIVALTANFVLKRLTGVRKCRM